MLSPQFKNAFLLCLALFLVSGWAVKEVEAQQRGSRRNAPFDVSMILKRIDSNGNGMLEPIEMKGPTKQFVRNAGLDPNRAHAITTITQKLNEKNKGNNEKAAESNGSATVNRKVPGFGVDRPAPIVPDFSPSGEERMSVEAMKRKFSQSVMDNVERTMKRYDKDKNGLVDAAEQRRTRWDNPSAEESDKNKDGSLSTLEMAYRYHDREQAALNKRNRVSTPSTRSRALSSTARASNETVRSYQSRRSNERSRSSRPSRSSSKSSSNSKTGFSSGSDAYRRYAEGLIKNYDKNGDKKLSKDEIKEMRRPLKNADTNKDGFVDKNEMIASVTNRSAGKETESAKKSGSKSRSSGSKLLDSKRRSANKSYNSNDSIFGGKDTNNDRQLQMVEFSDEWDAEKIGEFEAKDLNDDGVITEKEWNGI